MRGLLDSVLEIDERAAARLARVEKPPRWVRLWVVWATRSGDGWLWLALGAAVLILGGEHRFQAFATALAAAAAGVGIFWRLKRVLARPRPRLRQLWQASPLRCWEHDQYSFPSGHTITAFAVSVSLSHFYPQLAPWLGLAALSVGGSRLVLGVHYLSDVLTGAAIGAALGRAAVEVSAWLLTHFS